MALQALQKPDSILAVLTTSRFGMLERTSHSGKVSSSAPQAQLELSPDYLPTVSITWEAQQVSRVGVGSSSWKASSPVLLGQLPSSG